MWLVLGQSLMVISTTGILLYAKVSPIYNVLRECIVVVYMYILVSHCTSGHWALPGYKFSDLHLLWFLKNENDKIF